MTVATAAPDGPNINNVANTLTANESLVNTGDDSDTEVTTVTHTVDVTSRVRLLWPASYTNLGNKQYRGVFTITNTSSQTINGPIRLSWPSLPPGVSIVCSTSVASLAPGKTATIVVVFHNPVNYPLVRDHMVFRSFMRRFRGIGAGSDPPKTARKLSGCGRANGLQAVEIRRHDATDLTLVSAESDPFQLR